MNNANANETYEHVPLDLLLEGMWENYLALNPDARRIYTLFSQINNDVVVNDHIALRTFNLDKVCLDKIAQPFIASGYSEKGTYNFKKKKLTAKHFEHEDPSRPKIFISELRVEELSETTQKMIKILVSQLPEENVEDPHFCYSGCPWDISSGDYELLLKESEYAAWMAVFGYRPNHFTVSINHLKALTTVEEVNRFLLDKGFSLNENGGLIKGSPDVFLEQSSTMANEVDVTFSDGKKLRIPSCFYEFAKRYPLPNGKLYQGFVTTSADKIFESTNQQ